VRQALAQDVQAVPLHAHTRTQLAVPFGTDRKATPHHIVYRLETSATTRLAFHHRPTLYPTPAARCTWAKRRTSSRIEVCAGRVPDVGPPTRECCARQDDDVPSETTRLRPGAWVYFPDFFLPLTMPGMFSDTTAASKLDDEGG
jgi:hypothetical protein